MGVRQSVPQITEGGFGMSFYKIAIPLFFLIGLIMPAFADVQQVTSETYAQQVGQMQYWKNYLNQHSGNLSSTQVLAIEKWESYMTQQLASEQVVTNDLPVEKHFWEYFPQPFHMMLHVSYIIITFFVGFAIQQPITFLLWFTPMAFFFGALVLRMSRRQSFRLPKDFGSAPTDRITTETRVENNQIIEETAIERASFQNWNEGLWSLVKSNFSRDWENLLKWIAQHPEDVWKISKNSPKQNMACQVCGKKFEDNDLLERHIHDDHSDWSKMK